MVGPYGDLELREASMPPGFSAIDERALAEMSRYVVDLLDGIPYAAVVSAQAAVRAGWWRLGVDAGIERRPFSTVTVLGEHLRILNAPAVGYERFARLANALLVQLARVRSTH